MRERAVPEFRDPSLLDRALTHRSYLNEHPEESLEDNERLEFLGDAVLDFLSASYLYHRFPEMPEGRLTSLRASLVKTETLARVSAEFGLGQRLRLGKGEVDSGGRSRPANLCAGFEAVIGALYLDQGLDQVRAVVEPLFGSLLDDILAAELDKDAKSLLQEWSQATQGYTPVYETVLAEGPDHARQFTVQVMIGGVPYGSGVGRSKQAAARRAAEDALRRARPSPDTSAEPSTPDGGERPTS